MHKNQHAFRKGRSTESALSDTVDILESEVLRKGVAIGVFLDIEGAFDNLLPGGIIRSLQTRNTPQFLLSWFQNYLVTRNVQVDHKGVLANRRLVKGTPQGGVLSPVLWNLAFDEVLSLVEGTSIKACGYADDLALIGRGPDPKTILHNMQQVLNSVTNWGREQGLRFSAGKSVAIAFTHKRKWDEIPLHLNQIALEWQDRVKYLGVTLDSKLNWIANLREKTTKAIRLLFRYKQIVGKEFGPQPKYMRWMYTGIVRPALVYGAVVWWRKIYDTTHFKRFTKISRLALLTLGSVRKGTPTVGMEAIGYLSPIDLFLEGEVIKSWFRIRDIRPEIWDGIGSNTGRGHRHDLRKLVDNLSLPILEMDDIPEMKKWSRSYQVIIDFGSGTPLKSPIMCFTDGAKLKNDNTGCGYCINSPHMILKTKAFPIGKNSTVHQAELAAILQAAVNLLLYT